MSHILVYNQSVKVDLEAIRQHLPITLVAERLGLAPVRGRMRCLHPQRHAHGDRTPSVSINDSKGRFNCWVCSDVRGDLFELVMVVKGFGFKDCLRWLENEFPAIQTWKVEAKDQVPKGTKNSVTSRVESRSISESPILQILPAYKSQTHWREKAIYAFLKQLVPVHAESDEPREARAWLMSRRIFAKTWKSMSLFWIADYGKVNDWLQRKEHRDLYAEIGILNDQLNLRFYKHRLIIPYLDADRHPLHFQARSTDSFTTPKELSLKGTIPCPYNVSQLNGKPGVVYLCEGPIDTLTLIDKGLAAVGVPGVSHLKDEWLALFANKRVVLCFDNDIAGRKASEKILEKMQAHGIDASALDILPEGADINDWFVRK